jgi:type I restriction enzyme S subunit
MIADLKPYAEYKESGLPWLGPVPGHWGALSVKQEFDIQLGKMLQNTPQTVADVSVPYLKSQHVQWAHVRTSDLPRMWASPRDVSQFGVSPGDLLVCEGGEGGRCAVLKSIAPGAIIQNALHRVRPRGSSNNYFLAYAMAAVSSVGWFDAINNKATIAHFTRNKFGSLGIPLPPPAEQVAIVRFLDWANGRLERAIRAKRKVIALLKEQKQAIIHRAVTRGLDPTVPLKSSGIPWLGDIPQHWEVVRNMSLFAHRVEAGIAGLPVLQVSLRSGITAEDLDQFGRLKRLIANPTKYKLVRTSDLAYNTMRMWQGAIGVSPSDGLVSPAYVVLTPRQDTCPDFYDYVFHTDVYKQQVNRQSTGIVSDRNRLYWDRFKQMPNIAPARLEQEAIVRFIHSETGVLIAAISRLQREIDLLREYRTRLVADVVTGKLDVREAAIRLPNEAAPDTSAELAGDMLDDTGNLDEVEAEEI